MSEPLLQVNLRAGYGKSTVLDDVTLELHRGEALGLVGSSGAGKSTLVLALLGLLPWKQGWAKGSVRLHGEDILLRKERGWRGLRGKEIALVPQSPLSALNPALSIRAHFREAWRAHRNADAGRDMRVRALLEQVQLPANDDFLARKPEQISVGQAQRVVLALALLHKPALLIADEPTSALDPVTQQEIVQLLRRIQREQGVGLLYISHDLVSVLQLCDRIGVLANGRLSACTPVASLREETASVELQRLLRTLPAPLDTMLPYLRTEVTPQQGAYDGTVTDPVGDKVCVLR